MSYLPEILMGFPAVVKVGMTFVSILLLYRFGMSLGLSVAVHAIVLVFWSGAGLGGLRSQMLSLAAPRNSLLLAVILLLLFFTEALRASGRMTRTVNALKDWLRNNHLLFSGLPALIGLLPMPGGALFSAPLVESVDTQNKLTPSHKAAINYWFRHVWEYWWPLYPGVILAIRYSDLPIGLFFLVQLPFTLASVAAGYFFIIRRIARDSIETDRPLPDTRAMLSTLGPIGILVLMSVTGSLLLPRFGFQESTANLYSMLAGLCIALGLIFGSTPGAFRKSTAFFRSRSTWELMLVVAGAQAFAAALQIPVGSATLVSAMRDDFMRLGIPVLAVMVLIPFISGAVTGIAVGFVGASFPLVFALIGEHGSVNVIVATTTLAYASGYFGMMLSPVHICFVVTNEYFKARLLHSYQYIWRPAVTVFLTSLALAGSYYLLLRGIL